MALDLGELSIRLKLDNDLRGGLANAKRELESLPPVARREMVKVSRVFNEEGQKSGGLLAQGVRSGFMRNSPLIVAGIGAALAAGAPLMTASAGVLFGGIGAAAAAQTLEVREAWTALGRDVRDGAVADAAVLVPVYIEAADKIGAAFQRMRPQLGKAFADSAPLIDSFTDGIVALAENAMPGLVRSIASAGPVFDGFEHFLAATGTGLTDFFDAITGHSPAAGAAFASLGDIMGTLLPLLGELLGQGAELAAEVLPAVAAAMGLTLDVVQALGPALPLVAQGFIALKVAGSIGPMIAALGTRLGQLGQHSGVAATGMGKAGTAMQALGSAAGTGGLTGVLIGLSSYFGKIDSLSSKWAAALAEGGAAAEAARAQMSDFGAASRETTSGFDGFVLSLLGSGPVISATAGAIDGAKQKSRDFAGASSDLAREQEGAAAAITATTVAMVEQANQALAAIDSGFAYRNSVDQLEDAQAALAETIKNRTNADKDLRTTEEDVSRAMLAVEEQTYRTALAFGQQQADLTGLKEGTAAYDRFVQESMLSSLIQLQQSAGPEMAAAIGQQINALQAGGVAVSANTSLVNTLTSQVAGLTGQIHAVPGQKYVQIDAPTAPQIQQLRDLGYTVQTLPNGNIHVYANTAAAENALNYAARPRSTTITAYTQTVGHVGGRAAGGPIGRAGGGPVWGPGSTTSDSIPATGPNGSRYALSNDEHIVTAAEVQAAGGHGAVLGIRSAMLAGAFRRAEGGSVTQHGGPGGALMTARGVTVSGGIHLHVDGALTDRATMRRAAQMLEQELISLQRERQ